MKRFAAGILLLSVTLGAAACSDDGGDDDGESTSETIARPTTGVENDVATTAEAYFAAFVAGDGATTRTFLSARCDAALVEPDFSAFVASVPTSFPDLAITAWRVVDVDGDTAQVEYDTGVAAIDGPGPKQWVLENGAWKYDGCDGVADDADG